MKFGKPLLYKIPFARVGAVKNKLMYHVPTWELEKNKCFCK